MDPISFKEAGKVVSIGNESDPERVMVPYCNVSHPGSGLPFTVTRYKLSPLEREQILQTGNIYIVSPGIKPDPRLVTARCPFSVHGYKPVMG